MPQPMEDEDEQALPIARLGFVFFGGVWGLGFRVQGLGFGV